MQHRATVINQHYANVQPVLGKRDTVVIKLLSKEEVPQVDPNEPLLIADMPFKGSLSFLQFGKVNGEIEVRRLKESDLKPWPNQDFAKDYRRELRKDAQTLDGGKNIYLHSFVGDNLQSIPGPNNTLDRLSFSLLKVEAFGNPIVHFQGQLRNLEWEDYETIKHGWVYLARTAFAKIGNALPLPNRLEFKLRLIKEFKTEDFRGADYVKLFAFLYDYLESRIFSRGRLLIASDEMAREIMPELSEKERSELGFSDAEGQSDLLRVQADRFRNLFAHGKPELLKNLNDEVLKNKDREAHFDQLFKNKPLPLILS